MSDQAYLFSYFKGDFPDAYLLWSDDGLSWHHCYGGEPFFHASVGSQKIVRDPMITAGPDGVYHMSWTTGWEGKDIGYARSVDLVNWSKPRAIGLMEHEPRTLNCWAPEIIYDPTTRRYVVFWSSTILGRFNETLNPHRKDRRNHRVYYTTTADFEQFDVPRLLIEPGFNCIDANIAPAKGRYVMFFKDETDWPVAAKNIRIAWADRPTGPWGEISQPISPPDCWTEGPTGICIGGTWYVYFDKYKQGRYGAVCSNDLVNWSDCTERLTMPNDARHGSVLAVPPGVLENLLNSA